MRLFCEIFILLFLLSKANGQDCDVDSKDFLKNYTIFLITLSPKFMLTEKEILEKDKDSTMIKTFIRINKHAFDCGKLNKTNVDWQIFPSHFSFDEKQVANVYVYFKKRTVSQMNEAERIQVVGTLLNDFMYNMPRSYYGYERRSSIADNNYMCLDASGLVTRSPKVIRTCFSLWIVTPTEKIFHAGQQNYDSVEQENITTLALPNTKTYTSIPQLLFQNNMTCFPMSDNRETNMCTLLLTDNKIYVQICCCYHDLTKCHYPNMQNRQFLTLSHGDNNFTPAPDEHLMKRSCAYGNIDYQVFRQRTDTYFVLSDNLVPGDSKVIGEWCTLKYTFKNILNEKTQNFLLEMSAVQQDSGQSCPLKKDHKAIQCELIGNILNSCYYSVFIVFHTFNVECCCSETDMCNLDFIANDVLQAFPSSPTVNQCSAYHTNIQYLFGKHTKEDNYTIPCLTFYMISTDRILTGIPGVSIEILFDPNNEVFRPNHMEPMVVLADFTRRSACTDDELGAKNMKRHGLEVLYVEKCIGFQCDKHLINNIKNSFETNRKLFQTSCQILDFDVKSLSEFDRKIRKSTKFEDADKTFFCYTYMTKKENNKLNVKGGSLPVNSELDCAKTIADLFDNSPVPCTAGKDKNGVEYFLCCCFRGNGGDCASMAQGVWEYIDRNTILKTASEIERFNVQVANSECEIDNLNSLGFIQGDTCTRPTGCFKILDPLFGDVRAFEIWSGCNDRIVDLASHSRQMRIASMCLSPDALNKCTAVSLDDYFRDPDEDEPIGTEKLPLSYAILCCCTDKGCEKAHKNAKFGMKIN